MFLITDDGGGIATGLSLKLEALGVSTQVIQAGAAYKWLERMRSQGDRIAGLVHLAPLASWPEDADFHKRLEIELKALFHLARGSGIGLAFERRGQIDRRHTAGRCLRVYAGWRG
jgi:hypothetical protein